MLRTSCTWRALLLFQLQPSTLLTRIRVVMEKEMSTEGAHVFSASISFVQNLQALATKGQIVHMEKQDARPAKHSESQYMPPRLKKLLAKNGMKHLYSHQAEAVDVIFEGSNIVAATPTASGKSLIYTIPVLEALMTNSKSRAIFLFPLKALARDQLSALRKVMNLVTKKECCYNYDGDTSEAERVHVRKHGNVVLTNPDMLHCGILPNHKQWSHFFSNLKFIVVDEAHVYKGVFGSHVGCILRRLLRVARLYKAEPMLIGCSATIANPGKHLTSLSSMEVEVIGGSGAPSGDKYVVCWKCPESEKGDGMRSAYQEAADIVVELVAAGLQTLCFVEARKLTEIVTASIHEKLKKMHKPHLIPKVDSYRGGYSAEERQKLEKDLQSGALRALVTTNALELGIDVGALDATVHVGVPSSVASLWQQMGRAGRRHLPSVAVLIAMDRPLDQFYINSPAKLFERGVESVFCNPCNPHILRLHLPCAAKEVPLTDADCEMFGGEAFEVVRDELAEDGTLLWEEDEEDKGRGGGGYKYRWADSPAAHVSIRGISPNQFHLLDTDGNLIEEIDAKSAFRVIHKGAIYHHRRTTYEVVSLDIEGRRAVAKVVDSWHVTVVKETVTLRVLQVLGQAKVLCGAASWGKVVVREICSSFSTKHLLTDKVVGEEPLNLPPNEFDTIAMWWEVPVDVRLRLQSDSILFSAMLALKNLILAIIPSLTMCELRDVNGLAVMENESTPRIFIYDAFPGGVGITQQAFQNLGLLWERALEVLKICGCAYGCPACIQCGFHDKKSDIEVGAEKRSCVILLEGLTGQWMTKEPSTSGKAAALFPLDVNGIISDSRKEEKKMKTIISISDDDEDHPHISHDTNMELDSKDSKVRLLRNGRKPIKFPVVGKKRNAPITMLGDLSSPDKAYFQEKSVKGTMSKREKSNPFEEFVFSK